MFEKLRIIAICSIMWSFDAYAYIQTVAIPLRDVCIENSFILFSCDTDGNEHIVGSSIFQDNKIEYTQQDMSQKMINMQSLQQSVDDVISQINCHEIICVEQEGLYINFQIDSDFQIVKIIIVKNSFFIDNSDFQQDDMLYDLFGDDDDDDWADIENSDLPIVDCNKQIAEPRELSYYETMVLLSYVAWAYGQMQVTQTYNSTLEWFKSKYAE